MTPEQQRAIAIANARARAAEAEGQVVPAEAPAVPRQRPTLTDIQGDPREDLTLGTGTSPFMPLIPKNFKAGMGQAVDRALDAVTQMYLDASGEKGASDALRGIVSEKRELDKPLSESWEGATGNIAGNVAMTALPASKLTKGMAAATKAPTIFKNALMAKHGLQGPLLNAAASKGAETAARYGAATVVGAGSGALTPLAGDETREENVVEGAVMGPVSQLVGDVAGKAIGGIVRKGREYLSLPKAVRAKTTLGQAADQKTILGRTASRVEEASKNVPFVGSAVSNARRRGSDAWRDELLERVSPPNFTPNKNNPGVRDTIDDIQEAFHQRYKSALRGNTIAVDASFPNRVAAIVDDPTSGLTLEQAKTVKELVGRYHDKLFPPSNPAAAVPAELAKDLESFLTAKARQFRRSTVPEAADMADAFRKIEEAWTNTYRSQLPPGGSHAAQLAQLDKLYSQFKTVERAAASIGNDAGAFTPSQLLNAVKAQTTRPAFAAGRGQLQSDAQAGRAVFGDHLPDSGTTERALTTGLGFGLIKEAPKIMATAAVGVPMMTTQTGKNVMLGDTKLQKLLQKLRADQAIRQLAAPIGLAASEQQQQIPYEEQ